MRTILVSGVIANKYLNGGAVWTRLSWALGFKRLGFRVVFVEQIARSGCVDEAGAITPFESSVNLRYFQNVVTKFGLNDSALIYEGGEAVWGFSLDRLLDLARSAELLVNISGNLTLDSLKAVVPRKVFVDLDPGFTQLWQAQGSDAAGLGGHDFYYTVGANVGAPGNEIPTCGIQWRPIRQPVVLQEWPVAIRAPVEDRARFTTIASWRGPFGPVQHGTKTLGPKVHEFRKFIGLPAMAPLKFEIALDIHPADAKDAEALRERGWRVVDPKQVAPDPEGFRRYVQGSDGEFSVAQGAYVHTNSGWFSDRTVRYLASGKPALVQETGFSRHLPTGEGLISFTTLEEAAEGARRIMADYPRHCQAARAVAETFFDSDKVLGKLLEEIGL